MLVHAEDTVMIHRPVAEVFAIVSDPIKESQWNATVLRTEKLSGEPIGVGAVYRETHQVIFRQNSMIFEVVNYQPDHHFGTRSTSGGPEQTRMYTLEAHSEGTQVMLRAEVQVPAFLSILFPLLHRFAQQETIKSLTQLKQFLENDRAI